MKRIICFLVMLIPLFLMGEEVSLENFLEKFHDNYPEISTLKINFVQTKHSPMFLEPIQAGGSFYYMQTDNGTPLLRWEYAPPYEGWGMIKDNTYYAYTRKLNQLEVYSFEQYRHYQELLGALDFSEETIKELVEERYSLEIVEKEDRFQMLIQSREEQPAFAAIHLYFQKDGLEPVQMTYYEDTEEYVSFRFQEKKVNPELTEDLFELQVPENTTIVSEEEIQRMLQ